MNRTKKNDLGRKYAESETKKEGFPFRHWKVIAFYLVLYDIVAVNFSYFFGLLIRFDLRYSSIPKEYLNAFIKFAPFYTAFVIIIFYVFRLYNSLWRFASFSELNRVFFATIITTVFQVIGITVCLERMPLSYYIVGCGTQFALTLIVRFAYRYITLERTKMEHLQDAKNVHRAMIIGAGAAGQVILKELKSSDLVDAKACCIIDDNQNKWGRYMLGIPVVGGRDSILEAVEKYEIDQILFAIPTASPEEKRDILNICQETNCELKSLPGVYQLANGQVSLSKLKPVAVEDLLGREPIKANLDEVFQYIQGKKVLVTGAGGSIGSEISRQIAGHHPEQLILFDVYENSLYDLEQWLKRTYPDLNMIALTGSVRDSRRICQVFAQYKPDIVYHAAAHKHVPLMETSPNEAIKNNAVGTYKTAYAAMINGCQRFVLISTDKAVNPTNIMGASKRICEMIIQSFDRMIKEGKAHEMPMLYTHSEEENGIMHQIRQKKFIPRTEYVAVRFGNVLGSNGSVIPLFKRQIEEGGPVTVTHPDIIRYFMTIPEAVSLVLSAGTNAEGGEIFVLDMGSPVKIDTLARNLIRLSGHEPDVDIKIEYTGLRPGEKLFEEKLMADHLLRVRLFLLQIWIVSPIPDKIAKILDDKERIQWFASKQANAHDVFFVGRGIDYAICMEGSLKMKEISYIHSEAYAAGELKHGTISLIEDDILVVGVLTQPDLYEKTISNMVECRSRGAYLMGLTTFGQYNIEDSTDFAVYIPKIDPHFATSLAVIPLQLLGYYISVAKGLDVDKPRNLAKSVTVE